MNVAGSDLESSRGVGQADVRREKRKREGERERERERQTDTRGVGKRETESV